MQQEILVPRVAIACGGTGGHLFPGVAVAEELRQRGCAVTLLISQKEVDQTAVKSARDMDVTTLPAIALNSGGGVAFARGFVQSLRAAGRLFKSEQPEAVLAMGGFTGAPPILAGKARGAATFLHESNTIPGRANRWLSWMVTRAFVGFGETGSRLHTRQVQMTGTPVRPQFQPADAAACRAQLGLDPAKHVLFVTGGSQGASGLNDLVIEALPFVAKKFPELQLFHLTGPNDVAKVERAAAANQLKAIVKPFFADMHVALGAATIAVSRAGASSLAEMAAMCVPSVLVPYPTAMDNHQYFNAQAFERTGAAWMMQQRGGRAEALASKIIELLSEPETREKMRVALAQRHVPGAASQIAESMMRIITARRNAHGGAPMPASHKLDNRQSAHT